MVNQFTLCSLFNLKVWLIQTSEAAPSEKFSPEDLGCEIDSHEMAHELIASESRLDPSLPEIAPEDFEKAYGWFLS